MRPRTSRIRSIAVPGAVVALGVLVPAPGAGGQTSQAERAIEQRLNRIVGDVEGPPGAIVTLRRGGRTTVLNAGRADVRRRRPPERNDHMRIASVAKAFNGAVALRLVQQGVIGLDDTIARRRPDLPAQWGAVTVRQLLGRPRSTCRGR